MPLAVESLRVLCLVLGVTWTTSRVPRRQDQDVEEAQTLLELGTHGSPQAVLPLGTCPGLVLASRGSWSPEEHVLPLEEECQVDLCSPAPPTRRGQQLAAWLVRGGAHWLHQATSPELRKTPLQCGRGQRQGSVETATLPEPMSASHIHLVAQAGFSKSLIPDTADPG